MYFTSFDFISHTPGVLYFNKFHFKSFYQVVYYEVIKRDLYTENVYECRCDERLKTKGEGSTHLPYTVFYEVIPEISFQIISRKK